MLKAIFITLLIIIFSFGGYVYGLYSQKNTKGQFSASVYPNGMSTLEVSVDIGIFKMVSRPLKRSFFQKTDMTFGDLFASFSRVPKNRHTKIQNEHLMVLEFNDPMSRFFKDILVEHANVYKCDFIKTEDLSSQLFDQFKGLKITYDCSNLEHVEKIE